MDAVEVAEAMDIPGLAEFAKSYGSDAASIGRARAALHMDEPVAYNVRISGEGEI